MTLFDINTKEIQTRKHQFNLNATLKKTSNVKLWEDNVINTWNNNIENLKIRADSGYGIVDFECLWVIVVCRVVYRVLKSGFVIKELVCLCLDTLIEL